MTGSMPTWLAHHLEQQGLIDERGNSRRARHRRCTRCNAHILAGFDADLCARTVTVDPTPLDARGEAQALLTGRYTVHLRWAAGRLELDQRDHWQIRNHPAGTPGDRYDVLAEHECYTPRLSSAPSNLTPATAAAAGATPPF